MGGTRRQRIFGKSVAGFVARGGGNCEGTWGHESGGTLQRTVRQGTEKFYREIVERILFPVRHRERIPRQYSGGPACGPVVRGLERVGRYRATRNAQQGVEKHLRQQRDEIRERRDGRSERHRGGRTANQKQRTGAGMGGRDNA